MKFLAGIAMVAIAMVTLNPMPSLAQDGNSDYVVVVNKQMAASVIPKQALKGIYLREVKSWGNDAGEIIVVDMAESSEFYQNLFGKTYVQMQAYWLNQRIKYSVDLPVTKKTSAEVKEFIASNKGAIGFIKQNEVDDTVKVLKLK